MLIFFAVSFGLWVGLLMGFLGNSIVIVICLPILMVAFAGVATRRKR